MHTQAVAIARCNFRRIFFVVLSLRPDYPEISEAATRLLMVFSTTCFCKNKDSTHLYIKNKYRNLLQVESDLRIPLSYDRS